MTPRKREPLYRKIGSRYEKVRGRPWEMATIVFVLLMVIASIGALCNHYNLWYWIRIEIVPR